MMEGALLMGGEWRCAIVEPSTQCAMMDGHTMRQRLFVNTLATAYLTIVSSLACLVIFPVILNITVTGAVATGGGEFGLSDNAAIFQNLMCNGSEYTFSDCRGYAPNNIVGDYCSSGNHQAGVYCIEGIMLTFCDFIFI